MACGFDHVIWELRVRLGIRGLGLELRLRAPLLPGPYETKRSLFKATTTCANGGYPKP